MKEVFVLSWGENYEGSVVIGVYSTRRKAIAAFVKHTTPMRQFDSKFIKRNALLLESYDTTESKGCDYFSICRYIIDSD